MENFALLSRLLVVWSRTEITGGESCIWTCWLAIREKKSQEEHGMLGNPCRLINCNILSYEDFVATENISKTRNNGIKHIEVAKKKKVFHNFSFSSSVIVFVLHVFCKVSDNREELPGDRWHFPRTLDFIIQCQWTFIAVKYTHIWNCVTFELHDESSKVKWGICY